MAYLSEHVLNDSYQRLKGGSMSSKSKTLIIDRADYIGLGQLIYVQTRNEFRSSVIAKCTELQNTEDGPKKIGMIPVAKRSSLPLPKQSSTEIPVFLEDFCIQDLSHMRAGSENITMGIINKIIKDPVVGTKCYLANDKFIDQPPGSTPHELLIIADISATGEQCTEFMESVCASEKVRQKQNDHDMRISLFISCVSRQAIGKLAKHSRKWGYSFSYNRVVPSLKFHPFPRAWVSRARYWLSAGEELSEYQKIPVLYVSDFSIPNNLPPIFISKNRNVLDSLFFRRSDTTIADWENAIVNGKSIESRFVREVFGTEGRLRSHAARRWFETPHWDSSLDILALCSRERTVIDLMEITSLTRHDVVAMLNELTNFGYLRLISRTGNVYRRKVWRCTDAGARLLLSVMRRANSSAYRPLTSLSDDASIKALLKE